MLRCAGVISRKALNSMNALNVTLCDREITIAPFTAAHSDGLKASCAKDQEIWHIYPVNMLDEGFEAQLKAFHGEEGWVRFALCNHGQVVGTTSYIHPDLSNGTVMIGGTYIEPSVRGTGFNTRVKKLMIDHAFRCGFWRVEFTVDTRNQRSQAALAKLGAQREGVLRQNRKTWTGYVRDTAVFSILKDDWAS